MSGENQPKSPGRDDARSYSYVSGDSGYGAIGYGDSAAQRTMRDYMLIVRERVWYVIVVFLVVFAASMVFTVTATKQYTATATVEILRRESNVLKSAASVVEYSVVGVEDLNTQVKRIESSQTVERVAARLSPEDKKAFLAPYEKDSSEAVSVEQVIILNRKVVPIRQTLTVAIQYTHPDKYIAAKVANYFVDEYIAYNTRIKVDESIRTMEELKDKAEQQGKKVQDLALALQAYKERNNMLSLDQRKDTVTERLKAMSALVVQARSRLSSIEVLWNQIQLAEKEGRPLIDLSFMANKAAIQRLVDQQSNLTVTLSTYSKRYGPKHPKMIELKQSLEQTQREIAQAVKSNVENIRSEFEGAKTSVEDANRELTAQEAEANRLDRLAVEYQNLFRDLQISEQLYQSTLSRIKEMGLIVTIDNPTARQLDKAGAPQDPSYPKTGFNLLMGGLLGLFLGLFVALLIAFFDDRVKSAFDIETVIGLPLLGIIPELKDMQPEDKAQIVLSNADRHVAEAFLTLHSGLRLKDESKSAQVFLLTSTTPGEGKSFINANLAQTFAAHGERTILVDCDLRKPNVHRLFSVENQAGVIDYCVSGEKLESLVISNRAPNLDLLTTGGRAKNPTQILNSKNFEALIAELRKKYDKVLIDTPPLAAVSDAMIILPFVDGSLFAIMFNRVRRKAAQLCAQRLINSTVPCYGAILNGLNLSASGYYYAQYYDKSYKDYYVTVGERVDTSKE